MRKNSGRKSLSVRTVILTTFIITMFISLSVIGYLVLSNWISSVQQITEKIAADMNQEIYYQIESFMFMPEKINQVSHKIIKDDILTLTDEDARNKFFVGLLRSYDNHIYSISYGTVNGEYYGARRNENHVVEIMKNNADTGGRSWYYSVNKDLTAGDRVIQAGKFDPRIRAWYKAAEEAKGPTFSPLYKHFVMDDLTVSAAYPVYGDQGELKGVFGTHMLLSSIGSFLKNIVHDQNGYALIVDKNTGELIANSMDRDNFSVLQDNSLKRYRVSDMGVPVIQQAYEQYNKDQDKHFQLEEDDETLYINIEEYHKEGLDWIIISAIPGSLLMAEVSRNIQMTVILVIMALLFSVAIYNWITKKLLKPMNHLLDVADNISAGNFLDRATIVRNDEIGKLAQAFNKMADYLHELIHNLEDTVRTRTDDLEESKNQLRLLLDSTAEAIYGINMDGKCTFCNISCIKQLGFSNQNELLGQHMHSQIHHSRMDGTPLSLDECKIFQALKQGKGTHADDEVLWKADGTSFLVEYHAYPQIINGKVVGAVVTFMDIRERKKREEEIQYLSCHDTLTGLQNRRCFETSLKNMDIPDNLPLSVIFADINGLKMTNDIFGHAAGDALIVKSSEILRQSCRNHDIIARVGGDEFVILLPKTIRKDAEIILSRIQTGFLGARIAAIKCSISLGCATKTSIEQSIEETMSNAETAMYKEKTLNRKSINKDIIDTIIETLHKNSPREKQHSIAVSELCAQIGTALDLASTEIMKLRQAGYLHDIGKIVLDEHILSEDALTEEDREKLKQHSIIGFRILNLFDDTLDIAEGVYNHHERWDGEGYPKGLRGEEIPLISRILSIAETYDRVLNQSERPTSASQEKAMQVIVDGAGIRFDPQIVKVFEQIIKGNA